MMNRTSLVLSLLLATGCSDTSGKSTTTEESDAERDLASDMGGSDGAVTADTASEGACPQNWLTQTMAWNDLGYGEVGDGGFTLCYPPTWEVQGQNANSILLDIRRTGQIATIAGEVRTDHADALERLSSVDSAWCTTGLDYTYEFLDIGGWPGLQREYEYEAPPCGECGDLTPVYLRTVATHVAAGPYVAALDASVTTDVAPEIYAELRTIGRSITVDIPGTEPGDTAAEIAALVESRNPNCP